MDPIIQLSQQYLLHCQFQKNLSAKTLKAYAIDLRQFCEHAILSGQTDISSVGKPILRGYITNLVENYSIKTAKRKLACLKAFFHYLELEERIIDDPFRKMETKLKEHKKLPSVLWLPEITSVLTQAYNGLGEQGLRSYMGLAKYRDIAVIELLFATGIRVAELCSLKRCDFSSDMASIKITGKGNKDRTVYIGSKEVISALAKYLQAVEALKIESEHFFVNRLRNRLSEQSVRFMVKKYSELAGIAKKVTPHMFRHSFATLLLEEGVDIKHIQEFLGHSSITTTQIYVHISSESRRHVIETQHPRQKLSFSNR